MSLPKVSAYCATYGRPHLLEEAIESFLKQDYKGEKELVILNDYPEQTLIFEHPEVKVYNVSEKITPLGKKFNETVNRCTGDIVVVWEDDDIYLPNKLSVSVDKLIKSKKQIFHTQQAYYEESLGRIVKAIDHFKYDLLFHVNMAMYKSFFDSVGGYLETDNITLDVDSMSRFFTKANYKSEIVNQEDVFYIYRLNTTNSYHGTWLSGWNKEGSLSKASVEYIKQNDDKIIKGEYILKPYWKYDYIKLIQNAH